MENKENKRVDYERVIEEIWKRKKIFFITLPLALILSSLYIICIPRTYTSSTEFALEIETKGNSAGALGTIASTFGLDLSNLESSDAITPLLYPNLMTDNGFVYTLFDVKITSIDKVIQTDYYNYLKKYQKAPWWTIIWIKIKYAFAKKKEEKNSFQKNPYQLSKKDYDILNAIRDNTSIKVDKKTGAITISVTAQDPLVCKTITDSTREHLQNFITSYRTKKARKDVEYYKKLTAEAKQAYEQQRMAYGSYADANMEAMLETVRTKKEDLENEMQLRYNTYSIFNSQLQAAIAKVQERTPAFTVIKGAEVPIKPTAPKRMIFVLFMTLLTFIGTSIYVLRDIILPLNNK